MSGTNRSWWQAAVLGGAAVTLGLAAGCAGAGNNQATGANQPASNQTGASQTASSQAAGAGQVDQAKSPAGGLGTPGNGGEQGVSRCRTSELSTRLGTPTLHRGDTGITGGTVPLVYTNTSNRTCTMFGFGGVDLRGPDDPNGPVYSLRRGPNPQQDPDSGGTPTLVTLAPGTAAHTLITFVTPDGNSVGSAGSANWTPTEVVSTPPDETTQLTTPWLTGMSVLRQDMATRVGSHISPVLPGSG